MSWFRAILLLPFAAGCSQPKTGAPPEPTYDQSGRLAQLAFDANSNGRNDSVSYMNGTTILRVEQDLDEDGTMDAVTVYDADRAIQRIDLSTRRDGVFDKSEFYEANRLVRSEEDTNGDGRADKWETWQPLPAPKPNEPPYFITSTSFDDEGRGKPTRRFIYGPNGTIARVEADADGDGVFER